MASRKPLVINSGRVQQLQAGDTLDAVIGGTTEIQLTNAEGTPMIAGQVVYVFGTDSVKKAQATAPATATAIGLTAAAITNGVAGPVAVEGVLTLTTGQWDAMVGTSGGLTAGVIYFLSTAAGAMTNVAPSVVGQYVQRLGIALSSTELLLAVDDSILL